MLCQAEVPELSPALVPGGARRRSGTVQYITTNNDDNNNNNNNKDTIKYGRCVTTCTFIYIYIYIHRERGRERERERLGAVLGLAVQQQRLDGAPVAEITFRKTMFFLFGRTCCSGGLLFPTGTGTPNSLLSLSLLRLLDSNFPGNSLWAWAFPPLNFKSRLESNPLKSRIWVPRLAVRSFLMTSIRYMSKWGFSNPRTTA